MTPADASPNNSILRLFNNNQCIRLFQSHVPKFEGGKHLGEKLYFCWNAPITMESMKRPEESRQTKPITEKWISTVRERGVGGGHSEEKQNE